MRYALTTELIRRVPGAIQFDVTYCCCCAKNRICSTTKKKEIPENSKKNPEKGTKLRTPVMEDDLEPAPDPPPNSSTATASASEDSAPYMTQSPIPISPATPVDGRRKSSDRDFRSMYNGLKLKTNEYTAKTDKQLAAHREEINALRSKLQRVTSAQPKVISRQGDDEFLTKGKKKKCEFTSCTNDTEDALIKCNACEIWVCETCNDIPISKLKSVMNKCPGVYFVCKTCRELTIAMDPGTTEKMNELEKLVSSLQETEKTLLEQIQSANRESGSLRARIKELEDQAVKSENQFMYQGKLIQHTRKELEKREADLTEQQNGNLSSQKKIDEIQALLDKKTMEAVQLEGEFKKLRNNSNPGSIADTNIEAILNKRLDKIENSIDRIITKKLEESMKGVTEIGEKIDEAITTNKKTFAQTVGGNVTETLTTAFRDRQNQERVNEAEREKRSTNLIVYGVSEPNKESQKADDGAFVSALFEKIGVAHHPKEIIRLGPRNEDRARPVKLIMESENDKNTVLARLSNLKNAEDTFRKISIREDYTREEREMVRDMVKKAAEKNDAENTQEWKVRGTPKTGLRLVKITKRQ